MATLPWNPLSAVGQPVSRTSEVSGGIRHVSVAPAAPQVQGFTAHFSPDPSGLPHEVLGEGPTLPPLITGVKLAV